jgi:hypothetical protein
LFLLLNSSETPIQLPCQLPKRRNIHRNQRSYSQEGGNSKEGDAFSGAGKIFQGGRITTLYCKNQKLPNLIFFKQAGQNEYRGPEISKVGNRLQGGARIRGIYDDNSIIPAISFF